MTKDIIRISFFLKYKAHWLIEYKLYAYWCKAKYALSLYIYIPKLSGKDH